MFPDSRFARSFQCGAEKIKYLTNWGIAPHINDLLALEVSKSPCVVVEFNESLIKTTQECQMDIIDRFWDTECQRVKTRYWDSRLNGHSAHQYLLHFNDSIVSINSAKMLQVSKDGPTVNHKFYSEWKEISAPGMIDIGSCGLPIIHGAFKTGLESTGWALKTVLKGHTLFCMTLQHDVQIISLSLEVINSPCFLCNKVGRRHKTRREAFVSVTKYAETIPVLAFLAKKTAINWEEI